VQGKSTAPWELPARGELLARGELQALGEPLPWGLPVQAVRGEQAGRGEQAAQLPWAAAKQKMRHTNTVTEHKDDSLSGTLSKCIDPLSVLTQQVYSSTITANQELLHKHR